MNGRIRKREQDPDITRRSRLLLYVAFAAFAFLLGRLYWLQVVESERYRNLAENNRLRLRTVRAPRGLILDRMGRAIAETQGSFDLVCSPVDVKDLEAEIGLLAEIVEFDVDDSEVLDKIRLAKRSNPYSSITIARDLRFEQVSVIEFNRENLPGFSVLVEAKRSYPYGTAFAHVLGYVGEASPEELDRSEDETLAMGDMVGKYGLERLMDDDLRGVNGGRKVEVDAAGRDQRLIEEVPSRAGGAVYTSLDVDLQVTAQEALGNRAGAVIALAPRTGEVLAFYSGPTFDPNAFARGIRKADWQALNTDPRNPMQNKGLQGTYSPGSTIKPFLAMTALEDKMQEKGKTVLCTGSYHLGNRVFRCWKEKGHGAVDMYRGIVQSCDVYFYTLGLKLGPDRVAKLEKDAGLGTITGIDLPGEKKGLVPDTVWKRTVMKDRWYDYESVLLGIGQGSIHLTPLEMAVGYAALATGGEVMRPRVVSKVVGKDGKAVEHAPAMLRKLPWNPENVAFIRKALAGVVNDYGTGGGAKLPGIVVGGKTGTAQVFSVGQTEKYNEKDVAERLRDHALFVAFAPADAPKLAVAVLVENGGFGASAAAPIARAIFDAYLTEKPQ